MRPELQRALLRRCSNQTVETIARLERIGVSSARQRVDRATGEVFDTAPAELHRDPYALGFWVAAHLLCCLKHALAVLRQEAEGAA